ncbi:MAG: hypothetical protein H8E66_04610 [Planctomycetes bacterium]|nr:hypothetical protein [Planctomycetota bacterium]
MANIKKVTTRWRLWVGMLSTLTLSVGLAIGWWQDHQSHSADAEALRAEIERLSSPANAESLDAQRVDDLSKFIDEAYALLRAEGIHVKLDLDVDENGRYRLRADSVELMEDLKAKLRELAGPPATARADN